MVSCRSGWAIFAGWMGMKYIMSWEYISDLMSPHDEVLQKSRLGLNLLVSLSNLAGNAEAQPFYNVIIYPRDLLF